MPTHRQRHTQVHARLHTNTSFLTHLCSHIHAQKHKHVHACLQPQVPQRSLIHMHTFMPAATSAAAQSHTHAHVHARSHKCLSAVSYTRTRSCPQPQVPQRSLIHTQKSMPAATSVSVQSHTYAHVHACSRKCLSARASLLPQGVRQPVRLPVKRLTQHA